MNASINKIHNLPEYQRRILAIAALIILAPLILSLWVGNLKKSIVAVTTENSTASEAEVGSTNPPSPTPAGSILQSVSFFKAQMAGMLTGFIELFNETPFQIPGAELNPVPLPPPVTDQPQDRINMENSQ